LILSNLIPLGAVKDIKIFFDFFKAHIKKQLSNLTFLPWRSLHPIMHSLAYELYCYQLSHSTHHITDKRTIDF